MTKTTNFAEKQHFLGTREGDKFRSQIRKATSKTKTTPRTRH